MTIAKFMNKPDTLNDLGLLVIKTFDQVGKLGIKTVNILKFLLYDITVILQKLPFGQFISIIYFVLMATAIRNVVEGGELNRVLSRAIQLYFIQQKSYSECVSRFKSYLRRVSLSQIYEVQSFAYGVMLCVWDYTGRSIKQEVNRFALNNAENIENALNELAKTAAFSAIINAITHKLVSELGPVNNTDLAKSVIAITDNIESTNLDISQTFRSLRMSVQHNTDVIQSLSSNLAETVAIITETDISLNQKLSEISMQLEYLRINQPTQFREIWNAVSHSTLVDVLSKLTSTLRSSSYRRIDGF